MEKQKLKKHETELKPEFKLAEDYLDLRTLDTNVIIDYLEEQIKLRETAVEKQFSQQLKKVTKQ